LITGDKDQVSAVTSKEMREIPANATRGTCDKNVMMLKHCLGSK